VSLKKVSGVSVQVSAFTFPETRLRGAQRGEGPTPET